MTQPLIFRTPIYVFFRLIYVYSANSAISRQYYEISPTKLVSILLLDRRFLIPPSEYSTRKPGRRKHRRLYFCRDISYTSSSCLPTESRRRSCWRLPARRRRTGTGSSRPGSGGISDKTLLVIEGDVGRGGSVTLIIRDDFNAVVAPDTHA